MNFFEGPFKGVPLDQQIRNPNIRAGRYSYYSGYYHGHSFDDCARYLSPERDDVDKLIIGFLLFHRQRRQPHHGGQTRPPP